MQILYLILVFLVIWGQPSFGTAAEQAQQEQTATEASQPADNAEQPAAVPIHIEADRMESYEGKNEVIFIGRVEARQGDMLIQADRMIVTYPEKAGQEQGPPVQKIDKVAARGQVKITQENWVATGETVDYFAQERKAILSGDAKVWQDKNLVTGNRITLYLDEGKTIVERSERQGERVKAFIYPESKPETKEDTAAAPEKAAAPLQEEE